jgi:hypothetical protein
MDPLIAILGIASSVSTLLLLVIYSFSRIVTFNTVLRWVAIYSAVSCTTDALLQFGPPEANYYFLFTFTLLEYSLFARIFFLLLSKTINKNLVIAGSFGFLGMVSITLGDFGSQQFDNVNSGTEAILIIIYSILYFSEKLNNETLEPIFDNPGAFIVIGCLFYLAGNLFLFITSEEQSSSVWIINSLFNMTRNVFFLVGMRRCTKLKTSNNLHFS